MNKDFEHTQPLPRVSPDMESQKTQMLNASRVRELEPVEIPRRQSQPGSGYQAAGQSGQASGFGQAGQAGSFGQSGQAGQPGQGGNGYGGYGGAGSPPPMGNAGVNATGRPPQKSGKGKMIVLLVAGFVLAAFCGAALSGYLSEQQAKKAALDSQHAAATQQLQEADSQQESLNRKKEQLEAEYQHLLEEQKAAQSAADKLKGQKEQQEKLQQDKSAAGKVLDKITGDAGKQKKEAAATAAQEADARQKLEDISQSVQAAGAALDEMDAQLDNLEAMRQQAKSVKADVDRAYSENKDTIDTVLHYVSVGLSALFK